MQSLTPDYPIWNLPRGISQVISEAHDRTKAPTALIAASVLSSISLATQTHHRVEWLSNIQSPTGLFFLTIAESGERKSAVDRLFIEAHKDYESAQEHQYNAALALWRANHLSWKAKQSGLLKAIKKQAANDADAEQYEETLRQLMLEEPVAPQKRTRLTQKSTIEALLNKMHINGGCAGVIVNEGETFLKSGAASNAALLASIWSGDDITVDRVQADSFTLKSPRLTISLLIQPNPLINYLRGRGSSWIDSGLIARFLVSYPISTQGSRFITPGAVSNGYTETFNNRISEILERSTTSPTITLTLEPSASGILVNFINCVESELRPYGFFSDVRGSASKIAENAVRLAANLHVFENRPGEISAQTLEQAIAVSIWHLSEFKRLFGTQPQLSVPQQDAQLLLDWLAQRHMQLGPGPIKKNDVAQFGPSRLRSDRFRRDAAINHLIAAGSVCVYKQNGTTYITMIAQYQNSMPPYLAHQSRSM